MMTVWKFPLVITDLQMTAMPRGAKPLCVQLQGGGPCLWALVDPSEPMEEVPIICHGTGHPVEDRTSVYIGTVQIGPWVWHYFKADEGAAP